MLYADYMRETHGFETIIESEANEDVGFAVFKFIDDHEDSTRRGLYLQDMYVKPELRDTVIARRLADRVSGVGKEAGCRWLYTSVDPSAIDPTNSVRAIIRYGFELMSVKGSALYWKKSLES
jgi:GNAT superfamily N-acetyltransferase